MDHQLRSVVWLLYNWESEFSFGNVVKEIIGAVVERDAAWYGHNMGSHIQAFEEDEAIIALVRQLILEP